MKTSKLDKVDVRLSIILLVLIIFVSIASEDFGPLCMGLMFKMPAVAVPSVKGYTNTLSFLLIISILVATILCIVKKKLQYPRLKYTSQCFLVSIPAFYLISQVTVNIDSYLFLIINHNVNLFLMPSIFLTAYSLPALFVLSLHKDNKVNYPFIFSIVVSVSYALSIGLFEPRTEMFLGVAELINIYVKDEQVYKGWGTNDPLLVFCSILLPYCCVMYGISLILKRFRIRKWSLSSNSIMIATIFPFIAVSIYSLTSIAGVHPTKSAMTVSSIAAIASIVPGTALVLLEHQKSLNGDKRLVFRSTYLKICLSLASIWIVMANTFFGSVSSQYESGIARWQNSLRDYPFDDEYVLPLEGHLYYEVAHLNVSINFKNMILSDNRSGLLGQSVSYHVNEFLDYDNNYVNNKYRDKFVKLSHHERKLANKDGQSLKLNELELHPYVIKLLEDNGFDKLRDDDKGFSFLITDFFRCILADGGGDEFWAIEYDASVFNLQFYNIFGTQYFIQEKKYTHD